MNKFIELRAKLLYFLIVCVFRKCNHCKVKKSIRDDSFFAGSKLSIQRQTHFLWKWSQKDSLTVRESEGIAKMKALVKFARRCRMAIAVVTPYS